MAFCQQCKRLVLATPCPVFRYLCSLFRPCGRCPSFTQLLCRFLQSDPYPWAIVSDPLRAFLFVLVRDPEDFYGSKAEKKVLKKCEKLGFTASWNSPRKTVQEGCSYTTEPAEAAAAVEVGDGGALSSVLELRGGALGLGGPVHASCKASGHRLGVPDGPSHECGGTESTYCSLMLAPMLANFYLASC